MFGLSVLDYFVITWNSLFYLLFFCVIPVIFFKFFFYLFWETTNNSYTNGLAELIKKTLIILFSTLYLMSAIWSSPELFIWNNQLIITDSFFIINKFFIITALILLILLSTNTKLNCFDSLIKSTIPLVLFLFFSTQSLYTLIFVLEFFNLIFFTVLVLNTLFVFNKKLNYSNVNLNAIFLFFWINAFSALLLFILLFGITFLTYELDTNFNLFINSFNTFLTNTTVVDLQKTIDIISFNVMDLLFVLFLFIFFFKLGLPPFIFWKFSVFNNAPLTFSLLYTILYTPTIFFVFFYTQFFIFSPTIHDHTIQPLILLILTLTILFTLIISDRITDLSTFLALSSTYTFILIYIFIASYGSNFYNDSISTPPTPSIYLEFVKTYIYFYILSFVLLTTLINKKLQIIGIKSITYLVSNRSTLKYQKFYNWIMVIIFFSLSGLPPLPSFFIKLNFITLLNGSFISNTFNLIIIYLFIFGQLLFYFRTVRFFFITDDVFNVLSIRFIKSKFQLNYLIPVFMLNLIFSIFFMNDLFLFIYF